jgi:hypothetical protein
MDTEHTPPGDSGTAPCGEIRAETRDLKQLVKLALSRRKRRSAGTAASPLLILAPRVPVLPPALLQDNMLTDRDKLVWLNLRLRLSDTRHDRTLPGVRELGQSTGLGSKDTIARALAMLRCRRYLSVCAAAWHSGGRKVGTAYALHAPRLTVRDAIFLDPEYPGFVKNLKDHSVVRLRVAASQEIVSLSNLETETCPGVSLVSQDAK